jgi:hypothetical protein
VFLTAGTLKMVEDVERLTEELHPNALRELYVFGKVGIETPGCRKIETVAPFSRNAVGLALLIAVTVQITHYSCVHGWPD